MYHACRQRPFQPCAPSRSSDVFVILMSDDEFRMGIAEASSAVMTAMAPSTRARILRERRGRWSTQNVHVDSDIYCTGMALLSRIGVEGWGAWRVREEEEQRL